MCLTMPFLPSRTGTTFIVSAYSSTSQRGNAATPRPLATICSMMSVVSIALWRFGVMPAGVRNML
ncbi:hypothetical protein D9M68_958960 [compost metagenome]